jgi:hypothetical protein
MTAAGLLLQGNVSSYFWNKLTETYPAIWKQHLLTYALAAGVTFEMLSLWNYAV